MTPESTAYKVWVVSCRPFVEKIIGGFVETPDGIDLTMPVDGTFFLDQESAEKLAQELSKTYGKGVWSAHPAFLNIQKTKSEPIEKCGKVGCTRPAIGHAHGSLRYSTCDEHRAEIQALVDRE